MQSKYEGFVIEPVPDDLEESRLRRLNGFTSCVFMSGFIRERSTVYAPASVRVPFVYVTPLDSPWASEKERSA